eukprot:1155204-Pelagomonas_calceolata.AAC.1
MCEAAATDSHGRCAAVYLLMAKTLLVSLKEFTPGRRAESGTKQRSKTMSAFCRRAEQQGRTSTLPLLGETLLD